MNQQRVLVCKPTELSKAQAWSFFIEELELKE